MKVWFALVPAAALGLLNVVYDHYSDRGAAMAEARRMCLGELQKRGVSHKSRTRACDCMADNAMDWREANPDAEYTRAVHMTVALPCVQNLEAGPDYGLPRGGPGGEAEEPSDWGSEASSHGGLAAQQELEANVRRLRDTHAYHGANPARSDDGGWGE